MKIIKLQAENVKGLKAIEIVPDENFQIIGGKNGQGKTSVLDSIWLALGGKDAAKGLDKPIRDGEETAFATVDLGDIVVTRKWKGDTTSLDVRSKDGAKYSGPQAMLDQMIGKLSFDPLAFANMDEKKQKATLQELVGINFDDLDSKRKQFYTERTDMNRETDKFKALLDKLPYPAADAPQEELSVSSILQSLNEAQEVVKTNDRSRQELEALRTQAASDNKEIVNLEDQINKLQAELAIKKLNYEEICNKGRALSANVDELIDPDTAIFQTQLEQIGELNKKYRDSVEYKRVQEEHKQCIAASEFFTKQIKDIDQLKEETLQSAVFPIDGLSFDENGVTFNGIPFNQCSAAERLKISMAMAMALNPKLRVIRILDGSLLDSDNLTLISDMAKEKDYQVWVELVDSSGNMGITIENGEVKHIKEAV